jgi:8-oxo-dGTP pyrophosphatase MutT (NUDIX family)
MGDRPIAVHVRGQDLEARVSELAQIALLRSRPAGLELLVLRRGDTGVFSLPSGGIDANEDPRIAAARVLFEDTGVLLGRDASADTATTLEMPSLPALRRKILGGANATEVLRGAGFTWASEALFAWSHWQAPSSAGLSSPGIRIDGGVTSGNSTRVFVAPLPLGMVPAFEKSENAQPIWLLASEAEARGDELQLPPHALRTCWELAHFDKLAEVFAAARKRAQEPHPILPRVGPNLSLLLPWDPDYASGQGESLPFTYHPKWALGPSRFVRKDRTWKLV